MYVELCRKVWIAAGNLKNDTRGIAALEYALLAAIVLGALVAIGFNSDAVKGLFQDMNTALTGAQAAADAAKTP